MQTVSTRSDGRSEEKLLLPPLTPSHLPFSGHKTCIRVTTRSTDYPDSRSKTYRQNTHPEGKRKKPKRQAYNGSQTRKDQEDRVMKHVWTDAHREGKRQRQFKQIGNRHEDGKEKNKNKNKTNRKGSRQRLMRSSITKSTKETEYGSSSETCHGQGKGTRWSPVEDEEQLPPYRPEQTSSSALFSWLMKGGNLGSSA